MVGEETLRFFALILILTIFAALAVAIGFGWRRLLRRQSGYGFWAANLLTIPSISAAFGFYQYLTFKSPSCEPGTYHCFWTLDPMTRAADAAIFIWIIPIASLCISIPVTMWFATRKQIK